jgi:two-component system, cell cycle response regulator
MNGDRPSSPRKVLLLGFSEFERHALASYVRLSASRSPSYRQVETVADADFVIADADLPGAIDQVLAADRVADTVFIGTLAPERALAWAMRPIDPLQVFRELDATVALRHTDPAGPLSTSPAQLDAPLRRAGDVTQTPLALVVDDSEIAVRYLERQLGGLGLRTESAAQSTRALQMMSQQRYDVVFIDVDLGPLSDMDGLALCQHLKRAHRPPGTGLPPRVVIVTAHDSATDRVRGTLAGCDAYLAKPIDEATLAHDLRRMGLAAEVPRTHRRAKNGAPLTGPAPLG